MKNMTEKELRKLNRHDLLILLCEQKEQADQLEAKLRKAEEMLLERQIVQEECGTMAEAALKLNNIFADADYAAAQYLEEIRGIKEKQETLYAQVEAAAQKRSEALLASAEQEYLHRKAAANMLVHNAQEQAKQMISDAEQRVREERYRAEMIVWEAEQTARQKTKESDEIIRQTEQWASEEVARIDAYWNEILQRKEQMERKHSWMHRIFHSKAGKKV
jgi:hypothetical protein